MLLNHGLPTSFEFEGREYSFNLSFDRVLDVIEVKEDSDLTYEDKMDVILKPFRFSVILRIGKES